MFSYRVFSLELFSGNFKLFFYFCHMARTYKYFPQFIPTSATDIYVRILSNDNYPILGQYSSTTHLFTATASGLEYPHYVILAWRYV
jgi:hypothetical protein